ncbi:MAG: pentapeptide repeat-containing protein [Polyangiaceae bacterium]
MNVRTGVMVVLALAGCAPSMERAKLRDASLRDADLSSANLRQADLRGADLEGVDLSSANLDLANLRDARLEGADLSGATLRGADLRGAEVLPTYRCVVIGPWPVCSDQIHVTTPCSLPICDRVTDGANTRGVDWTGATCPNGLEADDSGGTCVPPAPR